MKLRALYPVLFAAVAATAVLALPGMGRAVYEPPSNCIAWYDGCNSCVRRGAGALCTMMACIQDQPREGYCREYASTSTPGESGTPHPAPVIAHPPKQSQATSSSPANTTAPNAGTSHKPVQNEAFVARFLHSVLWFLTHLF